MGEIPKLNYFDPKMTCSISDQWVRSCQLEISVSAIWQIQIKFSFLKSHTVCCNCWLIYSLFHFSISPILFAIFYIFQNENLILAFLVTIWLFPAWESGKSLHLFVLFMIRFCECKLWIFWQVWFDRRFCIITAHRTMDNQKGKSFYVQTICWFHEFCDIFRESRTLKLCETVCPKYDILKTCLRNL